LDLRTGASPFCVLLRASNRSATAKEERPRRGVSEWGVPQPDVRSRTGWSVRLGL